MDPILIVDDEADLVTAYERLLRRKGYHVVSAGSCRDGIFLIEREPLALVVTDLRLPDGDGLEIVRAARRTPTPTPALVVTGFASASSRTAAMAAGAAACVAKPFAASSLTALGRADPGRPLTSPSGAPALRSGALYFAVVFAAGWVLGPIRALLLEPRVGPLVAVALEAPLMVAVMIVAARWAVRRPGVVPTLAVRAAIGLVALTLLLVAELAGARWLRGLSSRDYLADLYSAPGAISLLLFLLFAALPVIVRRPPRP